MIVILSSVNMRLYIEYLRDRTTEILLSSLKVSIFVKHTHEFILNSLIH